MRTIKHTDNTGVWYTVDYSEEAARGIALLDHLTPGWYTKIDPAKLNLGDGRTCVLGQLIVQDYILIETARQWVSTEYTGRDLREVLRRLDERQSYFSDVDSALSIMSERGELEEIERKLREGYDAFAYGFDVNDEDSRVKVLYDVLEDTYLVVTFLYEQLGIAWINAIQAKLAADRAKEPVSEVRPLQLVGA